MAGHCVGIAGKMGAGGPKKEILPAIFFKLAALLWGGGFASCFVIMAGKKEISSQIMVSTEHDCGHRSFAAL